MAKIKALFAAAIKARQRVWTHDRTKTLGASETFACIRRGWFAKHRPDLKEEQDLGAAERGNIMERHHVVPSLQHIYGADNCLFMSEDQETLIFDKSSATPDGLIINQPDNVFEDDGLASIGGAGCFACEIKSFDPRAHIEEEKAIHRGQTIMQLGTYRKLTSYKPEWAVILYVNASIYTDVRPFFIKYDEDTFLEGLARGRKIFATTDPYALFAEGALNDECKHCPFTKACNDAEIKHYPSSVKDIGSDDLDVISKLVAGEIASKAAKNSATAEHGEYSELIKMKLAAVGTNFVDTDDFKVTYSRVDGRDSLNRVALIEYLEKQGLSIDDFTTTGNQHTRLLVTPKRKKKNG